MAIGLAPLVRVILFMLTLAPGSAEQVVIENMATDGREGAFIAYPAEERTVAVDVDDGIDQSTLLYIEVPYEAEGAFEWWSETTEEAGNIDITNELEQLDDAFYTETADGFEVVTEDGDEWYVELTETGVRLESVLLDNSAFYVSFE